MRMRERVLSRMAPQQLGDGPQSDSGTAVSDTYALAAAQVMAEPSRGLLEAVHTGSWVSLPVLLCIEAPPY